MVDDSTSISWELVYTLHSSVDMLIFRSFYLESWWHFMMDSTMEQHETFCKSQKKVRQRLWQWLDKRLGKKTWAVHRKSKFTETDKGKAGQRESQKHAHHFLWYQGDYMQTSHPRRPNSQFYILLFCADCVKICEDFALNFGHKRSGYCITTTHNLTLPFSPWNFDKKQNSCRPSLFRWN
jgi:hypothetical protein